MASFPRSPRLTKGAIVSIDRLNPVPKVILFQYNPDSLTRSLQAQTIEGEGSASEALRLKGPPLETISLDVELDATDQLEHPDQNQDAVKLGIHSQLAAFEIILYPKSSSVINNNLLAAHGTLEIVPPEAPFTVFVWGAKRVLPVRLTEFNVTEEAHDANLNPIRAKISLRMRVLSYADLESTHPGYSLFLTHHVLKETIAKVSSVSGLTSAGVGNLKLT